MAVKDLASVAIIVVSCLMFLIQVAGSVSAFSDNDLAETSRDIAYNDVDDVGDNLPKLLKLLGVVLETRNGKRELGYLTDKKSFRPVATVVTPYDMSELSSLLDKLTSSSFTEDQNGLSSSWKKSQQDGIPILPSKRARDEIFGAMPPLNELCRMMRVKCY